jgi:hypothetical protein
MHFKALRTMFTARPARRPELETKGGKKEAHKGRKKTRTVEELIDLDLLDIEQQADILLEKPTPATDRALPGKDTSLRPHGPIAELSVDSGELEITDTGSPDAKGAETEKSGNEVKTAVTNAAPAAFPDTPPANAAPPAAANKEAKSPDDSLNSLFNNEEEVENPLASLINSLPDVSSQELIDDLEEIQRIIKEWR